LIGNKGFIMSEYQYYEFSALDRPLTLEAQKQLKSVSSRVQLTPSSAIFVYNYTGLPADPHDLLAEYFDAMLYLTNWGTRQLMLRLPAQAISQDVRKQYSYPYALEWSSVGQYIILDIQSNPEEGGGEWVEGEGILSGLVQIRDDILRGDLRALYLAWLNAAHQDLNPQDNTSDSELDDEDFENNNLDSKEAGNLVEPPVPPNLQMLSPSLQNFITFFDLDQDLVTAAAQFSPTTTQSPADDLSAHIESLPQTEKDHFLMRLLQGEAHLDIALTNRLRQFIQPSDKDIHNPKGRTISELSGIAQKINQLRLEQERHKREIEKAKHLKTIAQKEGQLWTEVLHLIGEKKTNAYDQAIAILKDLRNLAEYEKRLSEFQAKMSGIQAQYPRLTALLRRLDEARLI
jgi:hypothetical protein